MVITGKLDRIMKLDDETLISFVIPPYMAGIKLDKSLIYKIEITQLKSKRSLQQNAYMWKVIHDIAHKIGMTNDEVYAQLIQMANIQYLELWVIPEALDMLKSMFRVVIEHERKDGKVNVSMYPGSSHFNTAEMSTFIDRLIDYAVANDVDIIEFREDTP